MMADRLLNARRSLIGVGLGLVAVVVAAWIGLAISDVKARLATADRNNRILAQQVRDLGGTPKVTPAPGPTGPAGASGQPGPSGQNGRNGSNGGPGSTGATGATGAAGSPGPAGATGPQGPAGPPGKDGQDGKDGATGPQGDTGPAGPPPSSWSWTYLGVTYTCVQDSPGATTYTCSPAAPALRRKN